MGSLASSPSTSVPATVISCAMFMYALVLTCNATGASLTAEMRSSTCAVSLPPAPSLTLQSMVARTPSALVVASVVL